MKLTHLLSAAFVMAAAANVSASVDADLNGKDPLTLKRMLTAERKKPHAHAHHGAMGPSLEAYTLALHSGNFAGVVAHVKALQEARIDAYLDELIVGDDTQPCITAAATVSGAMDKGAFKAGVHAALVGAGVADPADDTLVAMTEYYANLQQQLNNELAAYIVGLSGNDADLIFAGATGGNTASGTAEPVDDSRLELVTAITARIH